MNEKQPFYITTTLPYVNAPLHIGYAMEAVRADILARYKKLMGYDVFFNIGSDEHGAKIYESAQLAGMDTQEFIDQIVVTFKEQIKGLGISDDAHFIRTTDKYHEAAAQEFWKQVSNNGYIYKSNYSAKYCVGCEEEKTDSDLVDGKCPDHPKMDIQVISEENYFFKYSAFTEKLLAFYNENPHFVVPEFRFNEVLEFAKRGLQDFPISRLKSKMPWGIPVPGDDTQVMYVWFDALVNYISTLGWPNVDGDFKKYWIGGTPTQYCGKNNNRFQSAMWQAMLMAADLPNSHQIIINGFVTGEGGMKMSKSLGNGIDPRDLFNEYGTDALRMFLAKEISPWEDSPFTLDRFAAAYNANLVNGLGNLVSRTLTMAQSYDVDITDLVFPNFADISHPAYERFDYAEVAESIWAEIADLDKYISDTEPFKTFKVDPDKARADVHHVITGLARVSVLLQPIMPSTAEKIMELIKKREKPEVPLFTRK